MSNIMLMADTYADRFYHNRRHHDQSTEYDRAAARAALEAAVTEQAAEIAQLKESVSDLRAAAIILKAERDALQAKLSAMEEQKPVGEVRNSSAYFYNGMYTDKTDVPDGTKLYAAPKGAQPSKPTFAEWCATNWDGPPSANARDAYNRIIGGQHG